MSTALLWSNLLAATLALAVNLDGAFTGPREYRVLRSTVAALAAIYVTLYAATIAGVTTEEWRRAWAQGLGPVAFLTAWAWPPMRTRAVYRHSLMVIRRMTDRTVNRDTAHV